MTKLWVLSDLHYDHGGFRFEPPAEADIAIIAGDACDDDWLLALADRLPTAYVAGNHCFYGRDYHERLAELRSFKQLHFLENETVEIDGVRIAGCTLWTDYGYDPIAADAARRGMNDHRLIKWHKNPYERFLPSHATKLHQGSLRFLSSVKGADVIVTHHAPSVNSVHEKYATGPCAILNRAYYSDMDDVVRESGARYWIHGHVHSRFRYMIGDTKVICNPKGYPNGRKNENAEFDPALIVEV